MNRNNTLQAILGLEAELKRLSGTSTGNAVIKTASIEELKDAALQLDQHVFEPFESFDSTNVYHFKYAIKGTELTIVVKHTQEYRIQKTLVAI